MSYTIFNVSNNKKIFLTRKKRFEEKREGKQECLGGETRLRQRLRRGEAD